MALSWPGQWPFADRWYAWGAWLLEVGARMGRGWG